jgi:type II secretory pathway component PulF
MQNPYQPPGAPVSDADAAAQSRRQTGFFIMGVLCAVIGALVPTILVPQYKELFAAFGGDLPLATSVLVRFYPALWIIPVLLLFARGTWPKIATKGGAVAVAGLSFLVIVIPLTFYLLYLPVFQMAEAL